MHIVSQPDGHDQGRGGGGGVSVGTTVGMKRISETRKGYGF